MTIELKDAELTITETDREITVLVNKKRDGEVKKPLAYIEGYNILVYEKKL